jgi:hypothetical protein
LHYGWKQWSSRLCNTLACHQKFYKDHTTIGDGAIVGAGSGVTGISLLENLQLHRDTATPKDWLTSLKTPLLNYKKTEVNFFLF